MNTPCHLPLRAILSAALALKFAATALPANYIIPIGDPFSRGWYDNTGFHGLNPVFTDNYFAGREDFEEDRNFFIFALPTLSAGEVISSADLILYCPPTGFEGVDATEVYGVFAVENTTPAMLRAGGSGLTGIFADLGGGTAYSSGTIVSAADNGNDVTITLNSAFLAYAQANLGGEVAIGGAILSYQPVDNGYVEGVFGRSGLSAGVALNQTRLVVTTVPEPSAAMLCLAGLSIFAALGLGRHTGRHRDLEK